jgi:hypothetical protein
MKRAANTRNISEPSDTLARIRNALLEPLLQDLSAWRYIGT